MSKYSKTSKSRLDSCHPDLQLLMNAVLKHRDHSILCGHRTKAEQDKAVADGASKTVFPNSKHNSMPSMAVDIQQYPYGGDVKGLYMFIGYVQRVADELGIDIRCGADWDGDGSTKDQTFHDVFHVELI